MSDMDNEYTERARTYFGERLGQIQAAPEPVVGEPESGWDPATAWAELLPLLEPDEVARAQVDEDYAAQLEQTYRKWRARRIAAPAPSRSAPVAAVAPDDARPAVLAYESGTVAWAALSRGDRESVIARRVGPPPSRAIAEFEAGTRETHQITQNQYVEAAAREFDRRTARAKAERGERP